MKAQITIGKVLIGLVVVTGLAQVGVVIFSGAVLEGLELLALTALVDMGILGIVCFDSKIRDRVVDSIAIWIHDGGAKQALDRTTDMVLFGVLFLVGAFLAQASAVLGIGATIWSLTVYSVGSVVVAGVWIGFRHQILTARNFFGPAKQILVYLAGAFVLAMMVGGVILLWPLSVFTKLFVTPAPGEPRLRWWRVWLFLGIVGLLSVCSGLVLLQLRARPAETIATAHPNPYPPRPVFEPSLPQAGGVAGEPYVYPLPYVVRETYSHYGQPVYDRPHRYPGVGHTVAVLEEGDRGELYYSASGLDYPYNPTLEYSAAAGIFRGYGGQPVWGWVPVSTYADGEAWESLPDVGRWDGFTGEIVGDPRPRWGDVPEVMHAADGTLGSWDYDRRYYTLHLQVGEGQFTVVARPASDCPDEVGGWWLVQVYWGWPRFRYPADLACGAQGFTTDEPAFNLEYVNEGWVERQLVVLPLGLRATAHEAQVLSPRAAVTVTMIYKGPVTVERWRERFEVSTSRLRP